MGDLRFPTRDRTWVPCIARHILNHWALKKVPFLTNHFSSVAQSYPTLCNPMDCSMPGLPVRHQLLEFIQTHVHRVSDAIHLILCRPLLLPPSVFPSIRVFSNESVLRIRWPKNCSFSFSISSSSEYSGLISFRMDWLDLLAVQGTLKNLLQHHSSKGSILRRSAFFMVQLSHPYMTTGKIKVNWKWIKVNWKWSNRRWQEWTSTF